MLITANSTRRLFYMNRTASKHHAKRTTRQSEANDTIRAVNVLRSFLLTAALGSALLLIAALLTYFCKDPAAILPLSGLAVSLLTAFFGGMIAGRIHRCAPLIVGLLNGISVMLIMLPLSLLFTSQASHYTGWTSALLHTAFLLLSALGALASPQKRHVKRKSRSAAHRH